MSPAHRQASAAPAPTRSAAGRLGGDRGEQAWHGRCLDRAGHGRQRRQRGAGRRGAGVLEREGRIDALVAAAGWGVAGAAEYTSIAEAKAQFETNFWGCVRAVQAVLPHMRHQQRGRIVLISSIGGVIGIPFQAFYSASKFALEGFAEALAYEVAPFGVQVTLVQPGNIATDFTAQQAAGRWRRGRRCLCRGHDEGRHSHGTGRGQRRACRARRGDRSAGTRSGPCAIVRVRDAHRRSERSGTRWLEPHRTGVDTSLR